MKSELLKARVSKQLKEAISQLATERGESEGVIVREAVAHYLKALKARGWKPPLPAVPVHHRRDGDGRDGDGDGAELSGARRPGL